MLSASNLGVTTFLNMYMYIHIYGSIFGKRYLLAIDHIMLALFWSYVTNMK